ncbi:MAG: sigma-70 family RNA polymerase sigma factor [Spirochaetota bacterium]
MDNDSSLKDIVLRYQVSRSRDLLAALQMALASYIYHYPRKVFHRDHDAASVFYLYVFERLETVVLKFEDHGYRFTTWFTAVLRNLYLNHLRTRSDDASDRSLPLSENTADSVHGMPEDIARHECSEQDTRRDNILARLKDRFSVRDSLLFQMHFLELFKESIVIPLADHLSLSVHGALSVIERARRTYRKRYLRLLSLQDTYTRICSRVKKEDAPSRSLLARKNGLALRMEQIQLTVPFRHIARVFSVTLNLVSKVITKIRSFLRTRTSREAA